MARVNHQRLLTKLEVRVNKVLRNQKLLQDAQEELRVLTEALKETNKYLLAQLRDAKQHAEETRHIINNERTVTRLELENLKTALLYGNGTEREH